jgi:hypothetical protein
MSNQIITLRNLHLGITSITVGLVGLTYGICPGKILPLLFTFKVESVDLNRVFRATMGTLFGLSGNYRELMGVCFGV